MWHKHLSVFFIYLFIYFCCCCSFFTFHQHRNVAPRSRWCMFFLQGLSGVPGQPGEPGKEGKKVSKQPARGAAASLVVVKTVRCLVLVGGRPNSWMAFVIGGEAKMISRPPTSQGKTRASCLMIILTGFMGKEVKHTHSVAVRYLERKESSRLCGANLVSSSMCRLSGGFF